VAKEFDFYELVLTELKKINRYRRIIPFPLVFNRLGTIFHFDKETSILALKELEKRELVKLIPFHGVKILAKKVEYCEAVKPAHTHFKDK